MLQTLGSIILVGATIWLLWYVIKLEIKRGR